jgi:3-oxoacyl-[acyl-carrier protein] reductase
MVWIRYAAGPFSGNVVLVTGAGHEWSRSSGAIRLEGARVVINDVAPSVIAAAQAIAAAGGEAIGSWPTSREGRRGPPVRHRPRTPGRRQRAGQLCRLVNESRHFFEGDEPWWDRVLDVNLKGVYLCSDRAARLMARRNGGSIISMSSGGATRAHRGMSRTTRRRWHRGIHARGRVGPGAVRHSRQCRCAEARS